MFSLSEKAEVVCIPFSSPLMMETFVTDFLEVLCSQINPSEITQSLSSIPEHLKFCCAAVVLLVQLRPRGENPAPQGLGCSPRAFCTVKTLGR